MHKHLLTATLLGALAATGIAVAGGDDDAAAKKAMASFETVEGNSPGEAKAAPEEAAEETAKAGDDSAERTQ